MMFFFILLSIVLADYTVRFSVQLSPKKSGEFLIEIHDDWAPLGATRFLELVEQNYFDDVRFFRVISGFMAQFGIASNPKIGLEARKTVIKDDPVKYTNERGTLTFATSGKDTRSTQFFINFGNNKFLDSQGFSPIGKVIEGMDIVDGIFSGYGEGAPAGNGPSQGRANNEGNEYFNSDFPQLSYIKSVKLVDTDVVDLEDIIESDEKDLEKKKKKKKKKEYTN